MLTPRQRRFTEEFLVDVNGTQAAIRAGYSARTANEQAARLLANASIRAAVAEARQAMSRRTTIAADNVVTELAGLAFYDAGVIAAARIEKPEDIQKLPQQVRRAIVGWKWDREGRLVLSLSPKVPSLELLGRHFGLWNGPNGGAPTDDPDRAARVAVIRAKLHAMLQQFAVPEPLMIEGAKER